MKKYIKSITTALICFAVVIVINFALPRLLPGNPIAYLSGEPDAEMSAEKYDFYYNALHLGDSLPVQFGFYLKSIFDGSLGYSYRQEKTVSDIISGKLSYTLQLTLPTLLLSSFAGLAWGLSAALKRNKAGERISTGFNVAINAVPSFVMGLILILLFAFKFKIFPYSGLNSIGVTSGSPSFVLDRIYHLILPVFCLVLAQLPPKYLLVRNTASSVLNEKYVLFARQRGLSERQIKYKYILPNIVSPFLTMVGTGLASAICGSLVIENIFSIPGMGKLLTDAIHSLDYPLMQGILFVCTGISALAIVLMDIACILINPRLRLAGKEDMNEK